MFAYKTDGDFRRGVMIFYSNFTVTGTSKTDDDWIVFDRCLMMWLVDHVHTVYHRKPERPIWCVCVHSDQTIILLHISITGNPILFEYKNI